MQWHNTDNTFARDGCASVQCMFILPLFIIHIARRFLGAEDKSGVLIQAVCDFVLINQINHKFQENRVILDESSPKYMAILSSVEVDEEEDEEEEEDKEEQNRGKHDTLRRRFPLSNNYYFF